MRWSRTSAVVKGSGGAFSVLPVTGLDISLPVLIGLILLIGIAEKNSILLVDYAVMAQEQGMSRHEALMDACHKRARPLSLVVVPARLRWWTMLRRWRSEGETGRARAQAMG